MDCSVWIDGHAVSAHCRTTFAFRMRVRVFASASIGRNACACYTIRSWAEFSSFHYFPRRTFCRARCSRDQSKETLTLVLCALDGERESSSFFAAFLLDFIAILWICYLLHTYIVAINLVHTAHPSITFTAVFLEWNAQFRLMFGRAIDCDWNLLLQFYSIKTNHSCMIESKFKFADMDRLKRWQVGCTQFRWRADTVSKKHPIRLKFSINIHINYFVTCHFMCWCVHLAYAKLSNARFIRTGFMAESAMVFVRRLEFVGVKCSQHYSKFKTIRWVRALALCFNM